MRKDIPPGNGAGPLTRSRRPPAESATKRLPPALPESRRTAPLPERLRAALRRRPPAGILPPLREMARHFGVSLPALRQAMGVLRAEGLLDYGRGSRIRLRDPEAPPPALQAARPSSLAALTEEVVRRITSGLLPPGAVLPKRSSFAAEFGCSPNTVKRALQALEGRGLLQRAGRGWKVRGRAREGASGAPGRPGGGGRLRTREGEAMPAPGSAAGSSGRGGVEIWVSSWKVWHGICSARRTRDFGHAFLGEAGKSGLRLLLCCRNRERGPDWALPLPPPSGPGDTGFGTVGILAVCTAEDWESWLPWLNARAERGLPVVRFDPYGGAAPGPGPLPRRMHLVRFDETSALRASLGYLAGRGHRHIAYLWDGRSEWARARFETLSRLAREEFPSLRLLGKGDRPRSSWENGGDAGLRGELEQLRKADHPAVRSAWRAFAGKETVEGFIRFSDRVFRAHDAASVPGPTARSTPDRKGAAPSPSRLLDKARILWAGAGLLPRLLDPRISALLVQNDDFARAVVQPHLKTLGFAVPGDLSLLSFDHAFPELGYPLDTVDFGFWTLGYQAFHLLLRDIPGRAWKSQDHPGPPRIVEHGTVADLCA